MDLRIVCLIVILLINPMTWAQLKSYPEADLNPSCEACEYINGTGPKRISMISLPDDMVLDTRVFKLDPNLQKVVEKFADLPKHDEIKGYFVRLPVNKSDEALIASAGVAIALALPLDRKIVDQFDPKDPKPVLKEVAEFGKYFAEVLGPAAMGASVAYAIVAKDQPAVETVSRHLTAVVVVTLTNYSLKQAFHRGLPDDTTGIWDRARSNEASRMDFPSAHATTAISAATMIAHNTKDRPWIGALAYGAAGAAAFSRVHDREHFLSGVIASVYSHYLTKAIIDPDSRGSRQIQILPSIGPKRVGVDFIYHEKEPDVGCLSLPEEQRTPERCIRMRLGNSK